MEPSIPIRDVSSNPIPIIPEFQLCLCMKMAKVAYPKPQTTVDVVFPTIYGSVSRETIGVPHLFVGRHLPGSP